MDDNSTPNQERDPRRGREPRRFVSLIEQFHRRADQRRPQANGDRAHEAPLVAVTRRLVRATWLLVVIGFLSVGAAGLQWLALRSADEKTGENLVAIRKQLGVMRDQAKIAREQLVSSYRAFVYFSSFNIREPDPGKTIGISPVWGNSGNTPTLGLTITTACLQLDIPVDEPFDHMNKAERSTIKFVLAPKAIDNVLTCTIPVPLIGELNAGRAVLYILGEATYFDGITKTEPRLTQLSRQIVSINQSNIGDFRTRLVGAHNCADADCPK